MDKSKGKAGEMEEKSSSKLHVLDFVIAVLRQHEKSLDKKLAQFEMMLRRLEKISSDMTPLEENLEQNEPLRRGRIFADKHLGRKQGFSEPLRRPLLHRVEVEVLKLIAEGEPVEEIALRLNMDPLDVKETIADLAQRGYLYPKSLHE